VKQEILVGRHGDRELFFFLARGYRQRIMMLEADISLDSGDAEC
jgi:hypothetical protein